MPPSIIEIDYDCEFTSTHGVIDVASIALVADDGRQYYAIVKDCDRVALLANPWLMANVVPTLPLTRGTDASGDDFLAWDPDLPDYEKVKPRQQIAQEIRAFVLGDTTDPESLPVVKLWADYGAYDHVALCQLYGTMMDLPAGFPMWTHDIQQEIERLGLTDADLPQQQDGQHNALADALHQQAVRRWLKVRAEYAAYPQRMVLGSDLAPYEYGALTEAKLGRPLATEEAGQ